MYSTGGGGGEGNDGCYIDVTDCWMDAMASGVEATFLSGDVACSTNSAE